uniref:Uncharacterized protein n=1 Tax=Heterorhabditis bacteriophora TaxID=37862 RepID=A0A1I7WX92_HETBA
MLLFVIHIFLSNREQNLIVHVYNTFIALAFKNESLSLNCLISAFKLGRNSKIRLNKKTVKLTFASIYFLSLPLRLL